MDELNSSNEKKDICRWSRELYTTFLMAYAVFILRKGIFIRLLKLFFPFFKPLNLTFLNQDIVKKIEDNLEKYIDNLEITRIKEMFYDAKQDALKFVNKQLESFRDVNKMG